MILLDTSQDEIYSIIWAMKFNWVSGNNNNKTKKVKRARRMDANCNSIRNTRNT